MQTVKTSSIIGHSLVVLLPCPGKSNAIRAWDGCLTGGTTMKRMHGLVTAFNAAFVM